MRLRLRPDPDRGYEWWTCYLGPVGAAPERVGWSLKLGPVTVFDYLGFRGVALFDRWVLERAVR